MQVVFVHRPKSISAETSIDDPKKDYLVVYNFATDKQTTCINMTTMEAISPDEAVKGARYGRFECRVFKEDGNNKPLAIKKQTSTFQKDNSSLLQASGLVLGTALLLYMISKKDHTNDDL